MFVWIGIDVDSQLRALKRRTLEAEQRAGFSLVGSTLPMHISLKAPFEAPEALCPAILNAAGACFRETAPFTVPVLGLENEHVIAWLRMGESPELNRIHDALCGRLLRGFRIPLHQYDSDYKFHVTLLLDRDPGKNDRAFALLRDAPFPDRLRAARVCMGLSPAGGLGTYRVVRTLALEGGDREALR